MRALASVPGFVTGFSGTALNIASGGLTIDDAGFTVATAGASFSGAGGDRRHVPDRGQECAPQGEGAAAAHG